MSATKREYEANSRKPPIETRFKKGQSGKPRGRPAKNLAALLAAALNEKVTITENGKRRQATKRTPVIAQLVNKSASAELRATKMLIGVIRDIEKKAGPAPAERNPVSPTDKDVVQQLIARCAAASQWLSPRPRNGLTPIMTTAANDGIRLRPPMSSNSAMGRTACRLGLARRCSVIIIAVAVQ